MAQKETNYISLTESMLCAHIVIDLGLHIGQVERKDFVTTPCFNFNKDAMNGYIGIGTRFSRCCGDFKLQMCTTGQKSYNIKCPTVLKEFQLPVVLAICFPVHPLFLRLLSNLPVAFVKLKNL